MKALKIINKFILWPGLWLLTVTPAWAAIAEREDSSALFVWIFLGFCALIIVAQLLPALFVLFGFARGVKKEKLESVPPAPKPIDNLISQDGVRD